MKQKSLEKDEDILVKLQRRKTLEKKFLDIGKKGSKIINYDKLSKKKIYGK